jgi:hypothetical protein
MSTTSETMSGRTARPTPRKSLFRRALRAAILWLELRAGPSGGGVASGTGRPEPRPRRDPERRPGLGRVTLALRLAAGQSVEHVAGLFRVDASRLERLALSPPVSGLARSLATLKDLPRDSRLARFIAFAAALLAGEVRAGNRQAWAYAEACWRQDRDPAVVAARRVERLVGGVARTPEGLPPPRRSLARRPQHRRPAFVLGEADRAAMGYARLLAEAVLQGDAELLAVERRAIDEAPPECRPAMRRHMLRLGQPPWVPQTRPPSFDAHGPLMPGLPDSFRHNTAAPPAPLRPG